MSTNGVRIENAPDYLPRDVKIRPLRDHIVVKPLAWNPSEIIEVVGGKRKPLRGIVVAVGPGCYPKRYNKDRSKTWDSYVFQPCEVKVGQTVELGGLEIDGYLFQQILIGNETHLICREADVALIVE